MEDVVLFLHLVGVLSFVAGIAAAGVPFEAARRRDDPAEIALLLSVTRYGVALVGLGALLLFVCGLWLVELADVGFGTGWVLAAIVLFLTAVALGGAGGRTPRRARLLATRLAEGNQAVSDELRALLDDPRSRAANYASSALILVVLGLMVFEP